MFKTLIVDDNAEFGQSLNDALLARFPAMRVARAGTILHAWRAIRSLDPDLVFMDVKLPDGNGLDMVREIKAGYARSIVIVVTAFDLPEYRVAASERGASYFFSKGSATQADILSVVESVVGGGTPH